MPFSSEECFITSIAHGLCDRGVVVWQLMNIFRGQNLITAIPRFTCLGSDPVCDSMTRRGFAGHDAGPRGTAYSAGCVALIEPHAAGSEGVDVWTFIKRTAGVSQVLRSKIVYKNKQEIWSLGLSKGS